MSSAIVGVKSNIPIRGMIFRSGSRMGSVNWYIRATKGLSLLAVGNHDRIVLAKMAMTRTMMNALTIDTSNSKAHLILCCRVRPTFDKQQGQHCPQ